MEKVRMCNDIFRFAEYILEEEDEKTLEFLHILGNRLPVYFDENELAVVTLNLVAEITSNPEMFPGWGKTDATKMYWKILRVLEDKVPKEVHVIYKQPFVDDFKEAIRVHQKFLKCNIK